MTKQWKQINALETRFHKKFGNRIIKKNHKGRRVDKAFNTSKFLYRNWIYIGEFCVALVLSFTTLIFGNGNQTPNNTELVYPLQEVSTIDCRTQEWNSLNSDCKIPLPIIKGANYDNYANNKQYTDIYTVLFGGNYNSGWRTDIGSHYGVDIASAKGTPLYSIADGKIYFAGQQAGYGNVVKIEFIYQGTRYFAIYGHMDSISVKKGDSVSKGQKVGTIGNSGTTMGGLGGYHVHFEIAKGNLGRPVYAFFGCPDIKNGGIQVINNGQCRTEMFTYTADPIALLESANAKYPHPFTEKKTESEHGSAPELAIDENNREQIIRMAKLYLDSPYQLGATGTLPGMPTDCSKFTQNVFSNVGIELERSSEDQAYQFSLGGYWYDNLENAEVGDLLFFKNTYNAGPGREITHVGIYAGNGTMIHAGTKKVEISTLDSYWKSHFKGIGSFKLLNKNYNQEKAKQNYSALNKTTNSENIAKIVPSTPTVPEAKPSEIEHLSPTKDENLITLDSSRLDAIGKQFFEERDIHFSGDSSSTIKKGEQRILKLQITKENGDKFNGILKQPIILVANSTNISIDPVAISLVKNGEVEIKLTANQSGPVYTAINMGTNRMGSIAMKVM